MQIATTQLALTPADSVNGEGSSSQFSAGPVTYEAHTVVLSVPLPAKRPAMLVVTLRGAHVAVVGPWRFYIPVPSTR